MVLIKEVSTMAAKFKEEAEERRYKQMKNVSPKKKKQMKNANEN